MSGDRGALRRDEFLRGTAGLAAAGTGVGLLVPSAFARGNVKQGGVLRYVYTDTNAAEPTDPATQTGIAVSQPYLQNLYDRLTYLVPGTWAIQPQLATSWKASPDARTWTFKLRQGVKFHNGKTLDSKDVAWSFRRILDKKLGSGLYASLSAMLDSSGILTPNATTIVFRLKRPNALFPNTTSHRDAGISPAGLDPKKNPIGTGPFMHKTFKPTLGWELVRNPNYWKRGLPYLDGVRGVYISDPSTKLQTVLSGTGQLSDRIPLTQVGRLRNNGAVKLLVLPAGIFLDYALDATQEPFSDPRVAQAIKLAVDRRAVLRTAIQGNGVLTGDVPLPPTDPFYPPQRGVPAQEVTRARALLKAAGKSDLSFTLTTSDVYPGIVDMAVALKQTVARAGIDVTIKKAPVDTFWSDNWLKDAAFTAYWNRYHPYDIYNLLYRSNAVWNEAKYRRPKDDQLANRGGATLQPAKQRTIFRQLMNDVATQSGIGIPFLVNTTHAAKKNVNGIVVDTQYLLKLERAWLA